MKPRKSRRSGQINYLGERTEAAVLSLLSTQHCTFASVGLLFYISPSLVTLDTLRRTNQGRCPKSVGKFRKVF